MICAFYTLGCKVNQYESRLMASYFKEAGYTEGDFSKGADVLVINSCTVTGASDQKVRQTIHKARRNCPGAVIVLSGCMPQAFPGKANQWPEADIIVGNANRKEIVSLVEAFLKNRQQAVEICEHSSLYGEESLSEFGEKTRAFVKIEDGCNRFCTYCIIPYARGRVRSKPLDTLQEEMAGLADKGYKEIVLSGINLCAYGQDIESTLSEAVKAAAESEGIRRVRLGSLEPELITRDVIKEFSGVPKLCPQFHLSLQSGCDETLKRMNRRYDTELYRKTVAMLREAFPGCAVTTDIMAGFPGETEEEFSKSLAFAEEIAFAKAHIFAYSPREGTKAAQMPNQISRAVKNKRSASMEALTDISANQFLEKQVGQSAQVLFEQTENGFITGYTPEYSKVKLANTQGISGTIREVILTGIEGECLTGELLPDDIEAKL